MSGATPEPARRGLAVVRCGDRSLHESWAAGTTLFDVAVSYFGSNDQRAFPEARYVHRYKGGKWDGIAAFFAQHPELLDQYEHFWFPDDDLQMDGSAADRLLAIGQQYSLDIWQPALDRQSYFSHIMTLAVDGLLLRYTNFIEIMAPVLSRVVLKDTLPLFSQTKSGFGLDYLWPQRAAELSFAGHSGCAVIDSVTVTHTRPIGSVLRTAMKDAGGPSARAEFRAILQRVKHRNPLFLSMMLPVPRKRVNAGRGLHGRPVGRMGLALASLRDLGCAPGSRIAAVNRWELLRYIFTTFT